MQKEERKKKKKHRNWNKTKNMISNEEKETK